MSQELFVRAKNGELFIKEPKYGLAGHFLILFVWHLEQFIKKNLSSTIQLKFAGITRSIEKTLLGGVNRSRTSKHAAGLAVDIQITSEKHPFYTFGISNDYLARDKKLVLLIDVFMKKSKFKDFIRWGGHFNQGHLFSVDKNLSICIDELHHFEISEAYLYCFFLEYIDFLKQQQLSLPHSQKQLGSIYEKALELSYKQPFYIM